MEATCPPTGSRAISPDRESQALKHGAVEPARRIVILDDNVLVGQTIQLLLEDQDIGECRCLSDADAFFSMLQEWSPTHAILDLAMPDVDGVQILRELASRSPHIRVVLLSGLGQRVIDSARRYACEHGLHVDGALEKPVSPKRLREVLRASPESDFTHMRDIAKGPPPELAAADIQEALNRGEIEPFYQPKIDCATRMLAGFEVLARWRHPEHGLVFPADFLDQTEAAGLMDQLTESVADQALRWFSEHFGCGFGLSLNLNISRTSLRTDELLERMLERCKELNLDPRRIVLEVKESAVMKDPVGAIGLFTRTRTKGFELSVDDFGSGYCSLVQLVRLPFSELKIDREIVTSATSSHEGKLLLSTIIDLASNLQMRVTAEGVEDLATFELLSNLGCSCAQGFYFSEGLPAEEISLWVTQWEQTPLRQWQRATPRYG